jgi:hypothetical protein
MAESLTTRLGLPRWTAQTDTLNRAELDAAMASLEALVPKYAAGVDTARPAAGAGQAGALFVHTSGPRSGAVDYGDGATWRDLITRISSPLTVAPPAAGVGVTVAQAAAPTADAFRVLASDGVTVRYSVTNEGRIFHAASGDSQPNLLLRTPVAQTQNAVEVQAIGGAGAYFSVAKDGQATVDRRFASSATADAASLLRLVRRTGDTGDFINASGPSTGDAFRVTYQGGLRATVVGGTDANSDHVLTTPAGNSINIDAGVTRIAGRSASAAAVLSKPLGLGTALGSIQELLDLQTTVSNGSRLLTRLRRTVAGNNSHDAATHEIIRIVDVTEQQRIEMRGNGELFLGANPTGYINIRPSASSQAASIVLNGATSPLNTITAEMWNATGGNGTDATAILRFLGYSIAHADLGYHPGSTEGFRFTSTGTNYQPTNYANVGVGTLYYNGLSARSESRLKDTVRALSFDAKPKAAPAKGATAAPADDIVSRFRKARPVSYKLKDHGGDPRDRHGFIAEELAEVLPELAVRDVGSEDYGVVAPAGTGVAPRLAPSGRVIGYDLTALVTLTVGTVQALLDRVDDLDRRLSAIAA